MRHRSDRLANTRMPSHRAGAAAGSNGRRHSYDLHPRRVRRAERLVSAAAAAMGRDADLMLRAGGLDNVEARPGRDTCQAVSLPELWRASAMLRRGPPWVGTRPHDMTVDTRPVRDAGRPALH